ncbi:hypothetical protein C8F04DRAFT_1291168 [Mycena alexandri]|uniref:Uncharacterized protein n=1 Tax=Mycena alexandri TaxID=1745969 RepID=A0AAD6WUZ6_9AGAR|nr:hypothetical protein C8F04DRAFT_1291168 [Mycena alexandri]
MKRLSSVASTTATTTKAAVAPRTSVSSDCSVGWTPSCLQALYEIPITPAPPVADLFGISGFSNDFANLRDVTGFLKEFRPDLNPNTTFALISVDDGINKQLPGGAGEITIDMQYALGLTNGIPAAFISTGIVANDLFTEFPDQANYLVSSLNPPQTIVHVFSSRESLAPAAVAAFLCNSYAQQTFDD